MENYSDAVALTAIMADLQSRRFYYSLAKNAPRAFTELLVRAQKYSNMGDLINEKRSTDPDS